MLANLTGKTSHVIESGTPASGPVLSSFRPWLSKLKKPWWLVNDIYADYWIVRDKSKAKFRKIEWDEFLYTLDEDSVSRLTDPENAQLLEVAQLFCYFIREDKDSCINGTSQQCALTNNLKNIIIWMRLNGIYHFSQIRNYHFKSFTQKAPWGWPELHDVYVRFERYIEELKSKGERPPVIMKGKNKSGGKKYEYVDLFKISQEIGYDLIKFSGQKENSLKWTHRFWTHMQSFGILPPSNRRKEKEALLNQDEPSSCPLSVGSLQKYFQTWTHLYNLRGKFPNDSIHHNLMNGLGPVLLAKKIIKNADISSAEGRTESIPALQATFLIDRSIRWVLNYADDLLDLRDKYSQYYEEANEAVETRGLKNPDARARRRFKKYLKNFQPKGFTAADPAAPWPLDPYLKRGHFSKHLSLGQAVNTFLAIACAVVIAVFTARRAEEVMTIRDDSPNATDASPSAIEIDGEGEPWIWCWLEKTIQGWDKRPCPRIVVKAVEVLSRLSRSARVKDERRLFVVLSINKGTDTIEVQLSSGLIEFAKFVGVPPLEDGTHWRFTPHQFRKFFSLVYMWRYELSNLSALKEQLAHFSEYMTDRYAQEIKDTEVLREARKSHGTSLISDIASGLREADGSAGVRINNGLGKLTKRAFNNTEILSPSQNKLIISEIARRFVERTGLKMIPFHWGYCVSLDKLITNGFKGKCVKNEEDAATGPNFAYATPETCLDCPHFYTDNKFRSHWETNAKAWSQHSERNTVVGEPKKKALRWAEVYNKGLVKFFNKTSKGN